MAFHAYLRYSSPEQAHAISNFDATVVVVGWDGLDGTTWFRFRDR